MKKKLILPLILLNIIHHEKKRQMEDMDPDKLLNIIYDKIQKEHITGIDKKDFLTLKNASFRKNFFTKDEIEDLKKYNSYDKYSGLHNEIWNEIIKIKEEHIKEINCINQIKENKEIIFFKNKNDRSIFYKNKLENIYKEYECDVDKLNNYIEYLEKNQTKINLKEAYINHFLTNLDPHSIYHAPRSAEKFNIDISNSFEGIGAALTLTSEFKCKIVELIPGGSASNHLIVGDIIIGVGQSKDTIDNVELLNLSDIVAKIRGKEGSTVYLQILRGNETIVKKIIRKKIILEDQKAKLEIIEKENKFYGIIIAKNFYGDIIAMQKGIKNYSSLSNDVKRLIKTAVVQNNIQGLIIDLRGNGGGLLPEAINMSGLFLGEVPILNVKNKKRIDTLKSKLNKFYDGPLVVITDNFSASASEIFAGAIKDYNRGIILGSETYGKGTVQSIIPFRKGELKLTIGGFYRITGESTQFKGVKPDIELLFNKNYENFREKYNLNALQLEDIDKKFNFDGDGISKIRKQLNHKSIKRQKKKENIIKFFKSDTSKEELIDLANQILNNKSNFKNYEDLQQNYSKIEETIDNIIYNEASDILSDILKNEQINYNIKVQRDIERNELDFNININTNDYDIIV